MNIKIILKIIFNNYRSMTTNQFNEYVQEWYKVLENMNTCIEKNKFNKGNQFDKDAFLSYIKLFKSNVKLAHDVLMNDSSFSNKNSTWADSGLDCNDFILMGYVDYGLKNNITMNEIQGAIMSAMENPKNHNNLIEQFLFDVDKISDDNISDDKNVIQEYTKDDLQNDLNQEKLVQTDTSLLPSTSLPQDQSLPSEKDIPNKFLDVISDNNELFNEVVGMIKNISQENMDNTIKNVFSVSYNETPKGTVWSVSNDKLKVSYNLGILETIVFVISFMVSFLLGFRLFKR
jgi:hypothetical protein